MPSYARPDADNYVEWVATPAGTRWSTVDEVTPNDADYFGGLDGYNAISLSSVTPSGAGNTILRVRARTTATPRNLSVALATPGGAIHASRTSDLTTAFTTYAHTLTAAEVASVASWANLELRVESFSGGGTVQVSWLELEVPFGQAEFTGWGVPI